MITIFYQSNCPWFGCGYEEHSYESCLLFDNDSVMYETTVIFEHNRHRNQDSLSDINLKVGDFKPMTEA